MALLTDNLKQAISGESNAKRKYELFAEQAKQEGLLEISKIFLAISFAESFHIKNHIKALSILTDSEINPNDFVEIDDGKLKNNIKATKLNLLEAFNGETYETKKMYKKFVKNSRKNENYVAEMTFSLARKAEKIHAKIYSNLLSLLEKNKNIQQRETYVCTICGNVEFDKPPQFCKLCNHGEKFFNKM